MNPTLTQLELPNIPKIKSGKVREIFDLGNSFLLVATDRISAFDVVMPNGIPRKGEVLTQLSHFWFDRTEKLVPNHRLAGPEDPLPESLRDHEASLNGRSMVVCKATPLPIECVVRGYLAGSGWKEYRQHGTVCGIPLPPNLRESDELPEPIFTPATKAESGHDENISYDQAATMVDPDILRRARDLSIQIYREARQYARDRGIIVADTKFEFGLHEGSLILIDEVLTPDSSRFWPADAYAPGRSQPSFDKQFLRDYLESIHWSKTPPAPELPGEIVQKTSEKYVEAFRRITDRTL